MKPHLHQRRLGQELSDVMPKGLQPLSTTSKDRRALRPGLGKLWAGKESSTTTLPDPKVPSD